MEMNENLSDSEVISIHVDIFVKYVWKSLFQDFLSTFL